MNTPLRCPRRSEMMPPRLKVAVEELVMVSVNEPVCPPIEYVPDATNEPVSFSAMTGGLTATWPVAFRTLLLMLVTVKPACALATVSTRASRPVTLTLLPLTVPVRVSDANWLAVRFEPINPVSLIGLYWMEQPVCVMEALPFPLTGSVSMSVSTAAAIAWVYEPNSDTFQAPLTFAHGAAVPTLASCSEIQDRGCLHAPDGCHEREIPRTKTRRNNQVDLVKTSAG